MTDTTTAVLIGAGAVCGSILAMLSLLGVLWKVALPWLREQIVNPVGQVREHVANSHTTNLRADIDGLTKTVEEIRTTGDSTAREMAGLRGELTGHLTAAAGIDAGVHARLTALENRP